MTRAVANGWKNALVAAEASPGLIRKYRDYVKMLMNYAIQNETVSGITANPMTGFVYRTKVKRSVKIAGMTRGVRRGFTDEEARLILLAARQEKQPHLRWIPWLLCFLGTRLEEVCGAMAADIVQITGIWCSHIRIVLRDEGSSIKNEFSLRIMPLHPALVAEGFLEYVNSLPKDGPLFPGLKRDLFGSRAGTATKRLSRWLRKTVGITDRNIAPNHSFRHRFETIASRFSFARRE